MQVFVRKHEPFGHRPVTIQDAQYIALGAVRAVTSPAHRALAARGVNLAHDALTRKGTRFGDANELVADDASKSHIAPRDFKIGVADAGQADPHQRLARWCAGRWKALVVRKLLIEKQCAHNVRTPNPIYGRGTPHMGAPRVFTAFEALSNSRANSPAKLTLPVFSTEKYQ